VHEPHSSLHFLPVPLTLATPCCDCFDIRSRRNFYGQWNCDISEVVLSNVFVLISVAVMRFYLSIGLEEVVAEEREQMEEARKGKRTRS
jgi:hypothetical protein